MTPEERAAAALCCCPRSGRPHDDYCPAGNVGTIASVAAAIREAVDAETEALASIVESVATEHRAAQEEMVGTGADAATRQAYLCRDGAFCEEFGCGSFIQLAAEFRQRLTRRGASPAP